MRRAIVVVVFIFVALVAYTGTRSHPNTSRIREVLGFEESRETRSASTTPSIKISEGYTWYPVVQVIDGDTVVAKIDGRNATIRLIGLDTPETVDPRKPVQCFGKEASAKAKQILAGSSIRLEMDSSQDTYDKYGRTLAYVFLLNGTNFNQLMIVEGYGHEYTYNLPYKYQAEFKAAEKAAREAKRGLWADNACTASLKLRSTRASASTSPEHVVVTDGTYECSHNTYNCSSFTSQAEAQNVFESCGGSSNDVHKLDADGDGRVCESLP